jgi:flagellar hook assembly protein FlgD
MNISIYTIKGCKVKQVFDNHLGKGEHIIQWDKTDDSNRKISSGIYFYKVTMKHKTVTNVIRKLTLLK